ncbi:MAG TPA: T9SS type A sorting domain-containing protein, partial [Candidatus Cloacimonadota bacterium]|nr:T9SS type A sorting domain-containing protein [Candidatus Cloacimonadota bacterium]
YATVHLQLSGFPEVGEEQSFHVGPNPAIDETQGSVVPALKAYPNPFCGRLNISSKGLSELHLYNLKGQLIRSWQNPSEAVWDGCDSSGKVCPAGLYILQGESQNRKVLKLD